MQFPMATVKKNALYIFEMSLRRDSRIQSSFVVEKVVGVVKCFQQSKAFANNWIKQNEKKI
jgi:hypothetical protein